MYTFRDQTKFDSNFPEYSAKGTYKEMYNPQCP